MPINTSVSGGGSTPAMSGATAGASGAAGMVPAPAAGQQNSVLTGAGTWVAPEFGFVSLAYQTLTAGSTAYVDVPNTSMVLSAGTWQIAYAVTGDHSTSTTFTVAQVIVRSADNSVTLEGSQSTRPGSNTSALPLVKIFNVTVATQTTYKMSISNGDTSGAFSILNSALHRSTLTWTKLS
jgi:hypothetical protein